MTLLTGIIFTTLRRREDQVLSGETLEKYLENEIFLSIIHRGEIRIDEKVTQENEPPFEIMVY